MIEIDLNEFRPKKALRKEEPTLLPRTSFLNLSKIDFKSKEWSSNRKQHFFQDLAILLESGVDLSISLQVLIESSHSAIEKRVFEQLSSSLLKGISFAEAMKMTQKFSAYEYHCVRIGEEKSRLHEILAELATYHTNRIAQKRKIISAFSYPVIVIITAIVAVIFMLSYIVPMFQDIFTRFNKPLPALTLFVIGISKNLKFIILTIVLISCTLLITHLLNRNKMMYQKLISSLVLSTPILGKLLIQVQLAKFCLIMELLLSAKTQIIESLSLSVSIVKFYHFKHAVQEISKDILNGKSLSDSMKNFKIFDARMIALLAVAEEINQLETIFKQLKEQYNKNVEYQSSILNNVLEPVLILFIGFFVGIILISMYLPIFQISSSIM